MGHWALKLPSNIRVFFIGYKIPRPHRTNTQMALGVGLWCRKKRVPKNRGPQVRHPRGEASRQVGTRTWDLGALLVDADPPPLVPIVPPCAPVVEGLVDEAVDEFLALSLSCCMIVL